MFNWIKKLKNNYLTIFFLLCLSLLWVIYTYNDRLQYQLIKKVQLKNINVGKVYSETDNSRIKDVDINFSMKINQKNNISNIFSSGTEANPLMMRLVKPSSLQIVIGHNNPLGNKVYSLTDLFEYNKSHKIRIKVFKERQLWVVLDDIVVINIYDKKFNFDISKIQTNKTISDFNIGYSLYQKSQLITIVKYFLILFFIALSIQLFKKNIKFLTRGEKVKYVAYILFIGFIMAIFYQTGQTILGYTDPKNTFLFTPGTMFTDFIDPVNAPDIVTYSFFMTAIKQLFLLIGTEMSLTLFFVASIIILTIINIKEIGDKKFSKSSIFDVIVFSLLSYPFLFAISRGNFEILVFFFLYLFSYYLSKKNFILSAVVLSIAISIKLFPVVFLIVFLSFKKFKAVIYACLLTLFLNLTSLLIIAKTLSKNIYTIVRDYLSNYSGFYIKEQVIDNRGLVFGHSLYGLLKLCIFYFHKSTSITDITLKKVTSLFNIYTRIEIAIFVFFSAYIVFIEKELWKKVTLLVISMNLLPYVSADYKLINFFVPLYLFINKKERNKTDLFYVILFSLLLIPKNYYTTLLNLPDISLAVFLNPILMIILALLIIFEGLKNYYVRNYSR